MGNGNIKSFSSKGEISNNQQTITVSVKTKRHYKSVNHPEHCHDHEIGYPNKCNGNGNWCVTRSTKLGDCRCREGFIGRHCADLTLY